MSHEKQALMPNTSDKWVIEVGKKKYEASTEMIELIKKADQQGHRGMIWFKNFSISIPHIQSIYKLDKPPKSFREEHPEMLEEVSEEQRQANRAKIEEIKKQLAQK